MPAAGTVLVRAFADICRLRLGPQDLPASGVLFALALAPYVLTTYLIARIDLAPDVALIATGVNVTMEIVFTSGLLLLRRQPGRLLQTLTALAGSGALLGACAWPVVAWLAFARETDRGAALPGVLWLGLFAWSLAVTAHIFRHALDTRYPLAFAVTLLYVWLLLNVSRVLVPAAGAG